MDRISRALLYGMSLKLQSCITCSLLLALAGCAAAPPGTAERPAGAAPVAHMPPSNEPPATATAAQAAAAVTETAPANAANPAASVSSTAAAAAAAPAAAARPAPLASVVKAKPQAPAKATAPPAPSVAATPAQEQRPAAPTLDLTALEQRLRDTHAIGLFTKLSIKNQVDDLLDEFRAHHRGQSSTPLATLRQRYDLLLMKVLSLLQDGDPPLANAISSSREAIWGVLNDPAKLTAI
jgi:hypothetical protein